MGQREKPPQVKEYHQPPETGWSCNNWSSEPPEGLLLDLGLLAPGIVRKENFLLL
jgi:hypothetical protein